VLNAARTSAGLSVQDSISEANNVKSMAMAGSKGNDINISQIIACVGQQNVEGKRIPYGFRRRTLPHFAKDDLGPESRGFVENSYLRGLSPQEFFFHAMGGREGLIDTACKTAQTGYLQRRLVKSMESTAVQYDGTVRTNQGHVVQFLYGEDGGDGAWVEKQKFPSLLLGDDALRKAYSINLAEGRDKQGPVTQGVPLDVDVAAACRADPDLETLLEAELDRLKGDRDALRAIFACREPDRDADPFAQLPVNLERLVWAAQKQFECGERLDTAVLDPRVVLEGVTRLCVRIRTCRRDVGESNEQSPEATAAAAAEADDATQLFVILVRSTLAARKVVFEHRLNRAAFDWCVLRRPFHFLAPSPRRRPCDVVVSRRSCLAVTHVARGTTKHTSPARASAKPHDDAVTATPQARRRGRSPICASARPRRRDVRRARGPVHGRARHADDAEHLPLRGRECEERHARCPSLE
jgi:DNA-directed RNA polymerase II subunit RPB1